MFKRIIKFLARKQIIEAHLDGYIQGSSEGIEAYVRALKSAKGCCRDSLGDGEEATRRALNSENPGSTPGLPAKSTKRIKGKKTRK